jgi:hypothetical protein
MWHGSPVHITSDEFRGGRCSNGAARATSAAEPHASTPHL